MPSCPSCGTSTGTHWPNCPHYLGTVPASYGGKLNLELVEREARRIHKELYGTPSGIAQREGLDRGIEVMRHAIRRAYEGKYSA